MAKRPSENFVAIIGDIVGSKKLSRTTRAKLQLQFERLLEQLNLKYTPHLVAKLSITLGDEFQGISRNAEIIPELIWDIENGIADREFRIGLGYGALYTPISESSAKMDGPALHNARAAILNAKEKSSLGGTFEGFWELDKVLNGLAHILWFQRSHWTKQQRKVIANLRRGESQSDIAKRMKVSRQSISRHVLAAGWQPYFEAEEALRIVLRTCAYRGEKSTIEGRV